MGMNITTQKSNNFMATKDLQVTILESIKNEITNDPEGRGYEGKTDAEVTAMLNEPYEVEIIQKEVKPARINQILVGIAQTPNVIKAKDVTDAKK